MTEASYYLRGFLYLDQIFLSVQKYPYSLRLSMAKLGKNTFLIPTKTLLAKGDHSPHGFQITLSIYILKKNTSTVIAKYSIILITPLGFFVIEKYNIPNL